LLLGHAVKAKKPEISGFFLKRGILGVKVFFLFYSKILFLVVFGETIRFITCITVTIIPLVFPTP